LQRYRAQTFSTFCRYIIVIIFGILTHLTFYYQGLFRASICFICSSCSRGSSGSRGFSGSNGNIAVLAGLMGLYGLELKVALMALFNPD